MIKLTAEEITYSIPSSWSDVTYKQYLDLQNEKEDKKILSILCNMPIEIVERLSSGSVSKLATVISFVKEPIKLDEYTPPEYLTVLDGVKIHLVKDIRTCSFGQKIWFHEMLKDNKDDLISVLHEIVIIYSQSQITKKDFDINKINELNNVFDEIFLVDLYATAMFYVEQLKYILKIESEELKHNPTTEQRQAGIDMFNDYGVMNTIKALAGGGQDWILKVKEVENVEYNLAFTAMRMNRTQGIFEENYRKIMKNKK